MIPLRTDVPIRRTPWTNYGLIALNALIFGFFAMLSPSQREAVRSPYMIWPLEPRLYQFLTYQFLHADFLHLGGNMLFLWVFGNAVNSRMGQLTYAFFYLACGVGAGLGFVVAGDQNPCLGASGAIAGITTAFLALYPRNNITVFYWLFIFVGTISINAMWFIVGKIILWDNLFAMRFESGGVTSVAYEAHVAGYIIGFVLTMLMLLLRALPRDQFDLLSIWRRAHQRRMFAAAMADPETRARAQYGRVARMVSGSDAAPPVARPIDPADEFRQATAEAVGRGDLDLAVEHYRRLRTFDPEGTLPDAIQLVVANQLMARRDYSDAAAAYEAYLQRYPTRPDAEQVKLVLGIIYARYLHRFEAARRYLSECVEQLPTSQQKEQAGHWLREALAALQTGPASSMPSG